MSMSKYTKRPMSFSEYTMMRGTVDYSNAKQFNFFESGYSFLVILSRPKYIERLAEGGWETNNKFLKQIDSNDVYNLLNLFCYILENEFRGASGFDDITSEALEFSDGINTIATLGKTIQQSNGEITMQFTERSGAALTSFIEFYLKGCKKSRTQAKTYHGLIAAGLMAGGFENEVFNLLYIVTDNTLLGLEKAYLLLNAWPNKASTSTLYESEKGTIEMKTIDIPWTCFVMDGEEVNKRALEMLRYINEEDAVSNYYNKSLGENSNFDNKVKTAYKNAISATHNPGTAKSVAHPDDDRYNYYIYDKMNPSNKNSDVVKTQNEIYKNANNARGTL